MRHIPDLGEITAADMDAAEAKAGVKVEGHIVLLCTGFHERHYPSLDSVGRIRSSRWRRPVGSMTAAAVCMVSRDRRPTNRPTTSRAASLVSRSRQFALGMARQSRGAHRPGRVPVLRRANKVQGRLGLACSRLRGSRCLMTPDGARYGGASQPRIVGLLHCFHQSTCSAYEGGVPTGPSNKRKADRNPGGASSGNVDLR